MSAIQKIEACEFQCEAGPLSHSEDWISLKKLTDLYIIRRSGGSLVAHTQGRGGWGFTVFTEKEEAQSVADGWNRELYAGRILCTVHPFMSLTEEDTRPSGTLGEGL